MESIPQPISQACELRATVELIAACGMYVADPYPFSDRNSMLVTLTFL